jgi:hypothetical protein
MNRAFLASMLAIASVRAADVQSIYLLPMAGHLDLYVAEWLARGNAVHVTTDPKKADAVLTDRLGEDFERKLDQILPGDSGGAGDATAARYSAARNRGTIFLVDAKTREVLWSDYEKPRAGASIAKLNHEGEKIAKKLEAGLAQVRP